MSQQVPGSVGPGSGIRHLVLVEEIVSGPGPRIAASRIPKTIIRS
jgi:hypothetical protein